MTPQERDLILGVAQRLRNANLTQKDRDAEQVILAQIGSQKDALYLLTQAVIVQEQGLRHAQERIQQLEAASAQQGHGGFLSGLFGGGSSPPPPQQQPPPPAYPQAGGSASGIGTFLGTAAAAAAGAVGGQLIYDGMRHFLGGQGAPAPLAGGGFLSNNPPPAAAAGFGAPDFRGQPQDTDYSGSGGDFGGDTAGNDSGGDFGGDTGAADFGGDTSGNDSGGDFGGDEEDADTGGGDFGGADSSDDGSQSGGDF